MGDLIMNQEKKMENSIDETLNTISHGASFFLATVGFILLLIKGQSQHHHFELLSYFIYSVSIILLFLFSTLFHNLRPQRENDFITTFNHSSIYILLAGTATPFCLLTIGGAWGTWTLLIIYFLAICGICLKIDRFDFQFRPILEIAIYTLLTIAYLVMIQLLFNQLARIPLYLVIAGSLLYLSSAILYKLRLRHSLSLGKFISFIACTLIWFAIYLFL